LPNLGLCVRVGSLDAEVQRPEVAEFHDEAEVVDRFPQRKQRFTVKGLVDNPNLGQPALADDCQVGLPRFVAIVPLLPAQQLVAGGVAVVLDHPMPVEPVTNHSLQFRHASFLFVGQKRHRRVLK
jgi:hypothetical protein